MCSAITKRIVFVRNVTLQQRAKKSVFRFSVIILFFLVKPRVRRRDSIFLLVMWVTSPNYLQETNLFKAFWY